MKVPPASAAVHSRAARAAHRKFWGTALGPCSSLRDVCWSDRGVAWLPVRFDAEGPIDIAAEIHVVAAA